jgi:hypothetical protein
MDTRAPEPRAADERDLLLGWLAFHRDALAAKCAGLSAEQLVTRSAPPSDLSLLGLVRHLTEMERAYAVRALGDRSLPLVYCTDDEPDADIVGLTADLAEASLERWHQERAAADALIAAAASLDEVRPGRRLPVRWSLTKLTLEYARHNGHADLLRERIDGATGE